MTPKRKSLLVSVVILWAVVPLAEASTAKVKLSATTNPKSAQAGSSVAVTGSGFPSGTISPGNVTVTLTPSGGNAVSVTASSVGTIVGSTRIIGFAIPASISVTSPTIYAVGVSGKTSGGSAFASTNTSALTVTPPPSISLISPNSGIQGKTIAVGITGLYTHFAVGATQATFGPGISVNGGPKGGYGKVKVTSATAASATLVIDPAAPIGPNTVTVKTGTQQESLTGGFTVQSAAPPQVSITSPAPLAIFNASGNPITVEGTVNGPQDTVTVNGVVASVGSGTFTAQGVQLREGQNVITATATDPSGTVGTASETVTLSTTPPQVGILAPSDGAMLMTSTVTVSGNINQLVPGTVNAKQVTVTVNGIAATVSNRTFSAANVPLVQGQNTITVIATDLAGNNGQAQIHVNYMGSIPIQKILGISGDNQSGVISTMLPNPLVVQVVNSNGASIPNQPVTFSVVKSDGTLTSSNQQGQQVTVQTDQNGMASVQFQLGNRVGIANNQVAVTALGFVGELIFSASATVGPPTQILVNMGDNQTGVVGQALPSPFMVIVLDAGGNPVSAVPVTFTVEQGGGNFGGNTQLTASTDVNGVASAVLTLGQQEGINNNNVMATFSGYTGVPATFIASGQLGGPAASTGISGLVEDNSSLPVPGATVTLEGTTFSAMSDQNGNFSMAGVPVGTFLLKVDGHTSTRTDATFPTLVYSITTVAGLNNTLGMPVCLPPLDPTSVQQYDPTSNQPLTLQMTGINGYQFTVYPHSVFNPDGTPYTGPLSLSQVHADRVPMAPPNGTAPSIAGTLQPPNLRFNPPVKTQFPNSGGLPPGTVVDIFSYDHEQMDWVSQGLGRVVADGSVIVSDPGFGISKSGWHFAPPKPPPPTCASACVSTNPCQTLACVNGACQPTNVADGTECDDGSNVCGKAYCQGGACVPSNNTDGMACTPTDKCLKNPHCKNGQCTGDPFKPKFISDPTYAASVELPDGITSAVNTVIHYIPGLGGVSVQSAKVGAEASQEDCCDPSSGNIITNGKKEGNGNANLVLSANEVPVIPNLPSFDFKFGVKYIGQVHVTWDANLFASAELTVGVKIGGRKDQCKNQDCFFGDFGGKLGFTLDIKIEAIVCEQLFGTKQRCVGFSIVPGGASIDISANLRIHEPDCDTGLQGQAGIGQLTLFFGLEFDIPTKQTFQVQKKVLPAFVCTISGSGLSCAPES